MDKSITKKVPSKEGIILIDHGSRRDAANEMLRGVVQGLAERAPELIIEPAHMEIASPTLMEAMQNCRLRGATDVVVVPYMLSPGRHATEDIPRMVKEASWHFPDIYFSVAEPLGLHPHLITCILDRAAPCWQQNRSAKSIRMSLLA